MCFVDFTKAYDTVPRHLLWHKLQHNLGNHGWFLHALQALYASVPMAVSSADGMSDVFYSHLGLKQGCPLSPLLFGIFIDDFEKVVEKNRATLCMPKFAGAPVPPPLYADDLGLVSMASEGLQSQLDLLGAYSSVGPHRERQEDQGGRFQIPPLPSCALHSHIQGVACGGGTIVQIPGGRLA